MRCRQKVIAMGGLLALAGVSPAVAQTVAQTPSSASATAATGSVKTPAGRARAISLKAAATASVSRLQVFVAPGAKASALRIGIYTSDHGHPRRLLASGQAARAAVGWSTVDLRVTRLVKGKRYWIAVLARGGALRTPTTKGRCQSELSGQRALRQLPRSWRTGASSSRCALTAAALATPAAASTGGALILATPGAASAGAGAGAAGQTSAPKPAPGATVPPAGGEPAPPAGGGSTLPAAALGSPSAAVVAAAKSAPLLRFGRSYPGGADVNDGWGGGASMVLAMASYGGDTSADARLLAQIRDTIAGGNEPVANGGYPAQHERWVTAMFVLARRTPRIWSTLSDAERAKIDLVMTAALVASAFTTSDNNPYVKAHTGQVTLDGDTDVDRDWNPNYREGMVGMMLVGAAYFGSGAAAQAVIDGYDAASFLVALQAKGLTNEAATFSWKAAHPSSPAPAASTVQSAVKSYRYKGLALSQTMAIARALTVNTYVAHVNCGLNGGAGISTASGAAGVIVSGCSGLANAGQVGMLQEFDGVDAGGSRSSAHYSYDGFRVNQNNLIALRAAGLWTAGTDATEIVARLRVGVPDLWYKLAKGYRGYASGSLQYIEDAPSPGVLRDDNANFGFPYSRTLWQDVLRPGLGL